MGAAAEDYAPLYGFGMHPVSSSQNLDELRLLVAPCQLLFTLPDDPWLK